MMVAMSNGFLSDENVVRRPIENGNRSSSYGASAAPAKWKPRHVSAVRDFPPGCGPIAQPVDVVSREAASLTLVNDSRVDSIGANGLGTLKTGVESLSREVEDGGVGLSLEPQKMETESPVIKELQNGDTQALAKEAGAPISGVVQAGAVKPLSPPQSTTNASIVHHGAVPRNKFPQRRVSAVRDFPPYCGLNAPDPTEEERTRINGKRRSGEEYKDGGRSVRLTEAKTVGCEESKLNIQDGIVQKAQSEELRDRSLKGQMVDEVRFGVDRSTEAMITCSKESKGDVQDGAVQKREPEIIGVEPRNKLQDVTVNSGKGIAGQASQELVVYSRDKTLKRRHSIDPGGDESESKFQDVSVQDSELEEMISEPSNTSLAVIQNHGKDIDGQLREVRHENLLKRRPAGKADDLACTREEKRIVLGLMAPLFSPLSSAKEHLSSPDDHISRSKLKNSAAITSKKSKKKNAACGENLLDEKSSCGGKVAYTGTLDLVVRDEEDFVADNEEKIEDYPASEGQQSVDVTLPPFGPKGSSDIRYKVRETLRLFHFLCRKLLHGEESKTKEGDESKPGQRGKESKRIDLTVMKLLKKRGKELHTGLQKLGPVPGVEVGDEFQYRVELSLVGIHRLYQAGIDFFKRGKELVAASIVASGGYDDILDNPDCLIYSGSGGIGKDKLPEDQKLERGNLALMNNISLKHPVRVIRGAKETKAAESSASRPKITTTYVYDGLYTVERYWQEPGPQGYLVFKYELRRIPGQPQLALKEVKKSKKFKTREGICVDDITGGKELLRIPAVNTVDNEKPPPFTYITKMIYPDWYHGVPPKGCDCTGRCSKKRCLCAFRNGGEIPYNHNGAIVEVKPLVYECGPFCKCPPTCYNRVTQQGMKIQLEIFKTESRGWGVRSLNSISSGSFICEYIGELLEDKEAEKRTGNDEYLFDIGQNYSDCSLNTDAKSFEDGGFTIDAANCGNVGRFINHSCSPNLYAQNVLYDLEDKRMPHIMFFAAENIPPLQELTYHYNYAVNTVHDSDGNIKIKKCYCGSSDCTGRLY